MGAAPSRLVQSKGYIEYATAAAKVDMGVFFGTVRLSVATYASHGEGVHMWVAANNRRVNYAVGWPKQLWLCMPSLVAVVPTMCGVAPRKVAGCWSLPGSHNLQAEGRVSKAFAGS